MKYRNNLSDSSFNSYFEVVEPFEVFVRVGTFPSNTYYGSSQLFGSLYRRVKLAVGTRIDDLLGGVFAQLDGAMYEARMAVADKHPFEKTYGGPYEAWPVDKLKRVDKPEGSLRYMTTLPSVPAPSRGYVGRNIDAVEAG